MNTIFSYILDAEAETRQGDAFSSPETLSAYRRGSVGSFFAALRNNDQPALQAICWNLYVHYGRAHFDAAVSMVRGGIISEAVAALEAAGDVPVPALPRKLVFVKDDDVSRYVFDLNSIAAQTWLMRAADPTVYVIATDTELYPALEAAPCTPDQLDSMPDLLIAGSIIDATIEPSPKRVTELIVSAAASPARFEGRAKLIFVSRETHKVLTGILQKEAAKALGGFELTLNAVVQKD